MDNKLFNKDLAPVDLSERTWGALSYFSLWVGMAVCIPSYMIAASLITAGMSLLQAILCVFLGNLIVLIPMLLNGMVGTKHGIPYPVYARASFGVLGSNIPALARAIVACGWFGIQTWIGGMAIEAAIVQIWPNFSQLPPVLPEFMGVGTASFISFMLFWAVNVWIIIKGVNTIKILEIVSAPLLLLSGLALLGWAISKVGLTVLLEQPSTFKTSEEFWRAFIPGLTGMVGFWATMSLNIPDFTRYAKNQKGQLIGQALGLPTTMTMFALIGVMVTNATKSIYGQAIWDPVQVIKRFDSPTIIFTSMAIICLATLSTNVAANIVGPANDFSNIAPRKISFCKGGLITAFLGIIIMPWKLVADPQGYIFIWLIGYSSLLGPIGGILLCDYFLIRNQELQVDALYQQKGVYSYVGGINPNALIALVLGISANMPGFLYQLKLLDQVSPIWRIIYEYAWFVGLFLSATVYYLLMKKEAAKVNVCRSVIDTTNRGLEESVNDHCS